jgi:hypothetical protein
MAGGTYRFFVKAIDNAGNESDVVARSVFYVVPATLTVRLTGPGSVTTGFAGNTPREIGRTYTLTAKPSANHHFTGWTGSVVSASPTISFVMAEGTAITANFQ